MQEPVSLSEHVDAGDWNNTNTLSLVTYTDTAKGITSISELYLSPMRCIQVYTFGRKKTLDLN